MWHCCATLTQKLYYFLLKCEDNFVVWVEMKLVRDSISSQTAAFFTNHGSHFPQTPCEQRVPAHPCRKKVLCAARWQCVFLLKLRYSVQLNRYRIWRWTLTLIEGYFVVGLSFYKKKYKMLRAVYWIGQRSGQRCVTSLLGSEQIWNTVFCMFHMWNTYHASHGCPADGIYCMCFL